MTHIYKIARSTEWEPAKSNGYFEGSTDDKHDGFIHFSTEQQLETTFNKYFHDERNLYLICVESEKLEPDLKWEPSRGGDSFPHLYAPLPITHILWEKPINEGENILSQL